ncbi:MAG: antibiotic biosynthesis monooxygenase family protein [Candidatus Dormibacteraceae bacterium]
MTEQLLSPVGRVTLITTFTVPEESVETFIEYWKLIGVAMTESPGYLGAKLFKPLVGDGSAMLLQVADWESAQYLAEARAQPSVRAAESRLESELPRLVRRRVLYQQVAAFQVDGAERTLHQAPGEA